MALLEVQAAGLHCEAGDFYIDPWRGVARAIVTHAHSDHARPGSLEYLCAESCVDVLRARVGRKPVIRGIPYRAPVDFGGVRVSLHPAGHVLGSAQVRVEHRGEVWVVSGDYKVQADPTCAPFEPVPCDTFVTESTFGLPVYRWPSAESVFEGINAWWRENQAGDRTTVLFGYSLGKAQRLLAGLDPGIGPIFLHEAIEALLPAYRSAGIELPAAEPATPERIRAAAGRGLVVAPPGTKDSAWLAAFGKRSTGAASGWMRVRGKQSWQGTDRGFVLSDHADWPGLISAIRATGARRILVTHGFTKPMVRWLREQGWEADELKTHFEGEAGGGLAGGVAQPSAGPVSAEPTA